MTTTAHTPLLQRQASLHLRSGQHWHRKAAARKHVSVYADPAAHGCSTRKGVKAQASKGFGRAQEAQVTGFVGEGVHLLHFAVWC